MKRLNNKGMSLVTMLGITIFLIAAVGTALTFVVNDAFRVKNSVEESTDIPSAVNAVDASVNVLRDLWLGQETISEDDPVWGSLGVTLEIEEGGKAFRLSRNVGDKTVFSVVQVTSGGSTGFAFQVTKAHITDPNMKVGPLLNRFVNEVHNQTNDLSYPETIQHLKNRSDYQKVNANSVRDSRNFTNNTFVNGSAAPRNNAVWTIPDGTVVVVEGALAPGNNFRVRGGGTLIVGGSIAFANNVRIEGSVFAGGSISINNNFELGFVDMGFMFAVGAIDVRNNTHFTGFIISDSTVNIRNNSNLTGGVYAHGGEPTIGQNRIPEPLPDSLISNESTTGLILIDAQTDGVDADISIRTTRPVIENNPNYKSEDNPSSQNANK